MGRGGDEVIPLHIGLYVGLRITQSVVNWIMVISIHQDILTDTRFGLYYYAV